MSKKIGRNAPCPCGSGKKYKKCCIDSKDSFSNSSSEKIPDSIFNQHNSIDLIKTFAGISLSSQNHEKNVRLEDLARKAIVEFNSSTVEISEDVLCSFFKEHYTSHFDEDPTTNLFTDLITFYGGDYIIFPGITEGGNFVLSHLLKAIYHHPTCTLPERFTDNCMHVSLLILNLSNLIAKRLDYVRYIKDDIKESRIFIPSESELSKLKFAVTFSKVEILDLLKEKGIAIEALEGFTLSLDDSALHGQFIQDSPLLKHPIICFGDEYVIASPTTMSYALTEWILAEAKALGCFKEVEEAYHDIIWNYTQLNLSQLGFSLVKDPTLSETDNKGLREGIYQFDDDKLAYIQYVTGEDPTYETRKQQSINSVLGLPEYEGFQFMDITLVSSMGQDLFFMFGKTDNSKSIGMTIYEFEVLVNLKDHSALDLWKYLNAKEEKLEDSHSMGTSFLDLFKVYKENEDSFYLSDDSDEIRLHITYGYATDLYKEAKILRDEHSVLRSNNERLTHVGVVKKDQYAPVYYSTSDLGFELQFLVEGYYQPIWVSSDKEVKKMAKGSRSLYYEMTDAIAYWLWQCQEFVVDKLIALGADPILFKFNFDDEDRFNPIERNFTRDSQLSDHFKITSNRNQINITIPPSIIPYLYGTDNEGERELLRQLVDGFNLLLSNKGLSVIDQDGILKIIDNAAPLGSKKKIFILDTADNLLLDPSNLDKHRYIQNYDINVVLDSLVPRLGPLCPPEGKITDKETKTKLTRDIVMKVLLPKLQTTISQYNSELLLRRLIGLNESLIRKREDLRVKTPTRIACFVSFEEQTRDLHDSLVKINQTTIAVRCLIEHLAAEPINGTKIISTTGIDELVAIMSSIIDWGSLGDQIEFDLFDIKMGILPSKRVGTEKKLFKEIFDPYYASKSIENVKGALDTFEQVFPQHNPISGKEIPESLDNAFNSEFNISLTRICEFIDCLGKIAFNQDKAYACLSKSKLFIEINEHDFFSREEFENTLMYLCLFNRGKVHKIPKGFDSFDISPWRFNRRLSLLRKPLVVVDTESADDPLIYWGLRQVLVSRLYLNDQCRTNRLRVPEDGPIQKVLGKLSQHNGTELVKSVFREVEGENLIVDSEVPINPKSFLKNDKDIGDVDVLVIDPNTKTIYSLECKSMAPSRNIKEMVEEVGKLFGSDSKKGWIDKHVERDEWLKNNLELLGQKYQIDLSGYIIKSFFITQEDMLTPFLTTRPTAIPFLSLYTLKEKGLDAFKN